MSIYTQSVRPVHCTYCYRNSVMVSITSTWSGHTPTSFDRATDCARHPHLHKGRGTAIGIYTGAAENVQPKPCTPQTKGRMILEAFCHSGGQV